MSVMYFGRGVFTRDTTNARSHGVKRFGWYNTLYYTCDVVPRHGIHDVRSSAVRNIRRHDSDDITRRTCVRATVFKPIATAETRSHTRVCKPIRFSVRDVFVNTAEIRFLLETNNSIRHEYALRTHSNLFCFIYSSYPCRCLHRDDNRQDDATGRYG